MFLLFDFENLLMILCILVEVTKCAVCEQVASVMQRLLRNPNIDHEMNHIHEKSCRALSKKDQSLVSSQN